MQKCIIINIISLPTCSLLNLFSTQKSNRKIAELVHTIYKTNAYEQRVCHFFATGFLGRGGGPAMSGEGGDGMLGMRLRWDLLSCAAIIDMMFAGLMIVRACVCTCVHTCIPYSEQKG